VADHGRRQAGSVEDELYADASRFTFLQAVRLVEQIELRNGHGKPVGETVHADQELLFFRHFVRLDNPDTDVESLDRAADDERPSMVTNVLGLAGVLGPLPHPVTEMVIDHLRHGPRHRPKHRPPREFAAFLDIFNHRLLSLLYRARKKYRPALDPSGPDDGRMSRVLYAFLGLGTPHLQGRVLKPASDRPLLAYAGLFAERYRSPAGLERMVADHFDVTAKVKPFIGAWEEIDEDDFTRLGVENNVLGKSAFIGHRIWNQAARFEVRIGPLDFASFRSFIPEAKDAYAPLRSLIRFYAHDHLGLFDIRLILASGQMPQLTLSRRGGAYLGRDTWLRRLPQLALSRAAGAHLGRDTWLRPPEREDDQVRLAGPR
jgi:type VI secretion system protein ImpH